MPITKRQAAKAAIVLLASGVALTLILAPTCIEPIEPTSGRPYHALGADHPEFVPKHAPQRALAVFVVAVALWITNVIPLAATGLLAIALLPLLDVMPAPVAFSYFGNRAVFFILGVFLLAAAMIDTGLSKRMTLVFLQRFDRGPGRLIVGVVCSAAFLALWMPAHAVAAMMFPIILEIAEALRLERGRSNYAKMLFLGLAWGATIGSVGTFLGGARAPLAIGLLKDKFPEAHVTFLGWAAAAMPVVLVLVLVAVGLLRRWFRTDLTDVRGATAMIDERVRSLGRMSARERRLAGLGLATVAAWIGLGDRIGLGVIAVLAAAMLFVLRIAPWRRLQDYVNWGVVVMYGGAVALASALDETHAAEALVSRALAGRQIPPFALLVLMSLIAIGLTETMSNAAAVAVLMPIGLGLCIPAGIAPLTMTLAITIPAGLAFSLPISSPPNAISFSAGYYGVRDVLRAGVPMNVISLIVFLLVMRFVWPWIGLRL